MYNSSFINIIIVLIIGMVLTSCKETGTTNNNADSKDKALQEIKSACTPLLRKHLDAVINKDLESLKQTLSPTGKMQLILPGQEMTSTTQAFLDFHEEWFKDTTWSLESKIIDMTIGNDLAVAVTEQLYTEPERNGKPYFNKMHVSYGLQLINNQWYVIKDHCSSIDKTK